MPVNIKTAPTTGSSPVRNGDCAPHPAALFAASRSIIRFGRMRQTRSVRLPTDAAVAPDSLHRDSVPARWIGNLRHRIKDGKRSRAWTKQMRAKEKIKLGHNICRQQEIGRAHV